MKNDRFTRIRQLIGSEGLALLKESHVAVIGLGAVGGHATEALARAGVGHLRLVDFDLVRHSNINRQLYALESNIGRLKCEVARERVLEINPDCCVEALPLFADPQTLETILGGPLDLVIDAIDSVGPKIELLSQTITRGIRMISCMGAALRTDPFQIRVGRLAEVRCCPLGRRVRKELRRRGLPLDVCCVYSTETTERLPAGAISFDRAEEEESLRRGRKRSVLGSLPTITGIFGLIAANTALQWLLGERSPGEHKKSVVGAKFQTVD